MDTADAGGLFLRRLSCDALGGVVDATDRVEQPQLLSRSHCTIRAAIVVEGGGARHRIGEQLEPTCRRAILERALTSRAAATPLVPDAASTYPMLRGAAAIVAAPYFAAPRVA